MTDTKLSDYNNRLSQDGLFVNGLRYAFPKTSDGYLERLSALEKRVEEAERQRYWCVTGRDGTSLGGGIDKRCYVRAESKERALEIGTPFVLKSYGEYNAFEIEVIDAPPEPENDE